MERACLQGMDATAFLRQTRLAEALNDADAAEQAFFAVLTAIGAHIQMDDRRAMAAVLPSPIGNALLEPHHRGPTTPDTVYAEVAAVCGMSLGQAAEVVQTVVGVLAAHLPEGLRAQVARHVGPAVSPLWSRRKISARSVVRPRRPPLPGKGHTLASGRPGSRHPLSEAGPLGHPDSVAANPEPAKDRKLSSARGISAEQEHRTLAEGRPGSSHPISEEPD